MLKDLYIVLKSRTRQGLTPYISPIWLERKFVNGTLLDEDIGNIDDIQEVEKLLKKDKERTEEQK